jgi:hypothetical protein
METMALDIEFAQEKLPQTPVYPMGERLPTMIETNEDPATYHGSFFSGRYAQFKLKYFFQGSIRICRVNRDVTATGGA